MSDKKIIAVVGATGAQGGGLARAILADPDGGFAVRALTRDPAKDAATALAERGAEVVQADLDDEASLTAAFEGAYGAYCVTNFWEHFSEDKEIEQAGNLARAAKAAGIKHAIWSTVEDIGKCAYAIFKAGAEYIGKTVGIAGEHLTGAEIAVAFTKALARRCGT